MIILFMNNHLIKLQDLVYEINVRNPDSQRVVLSVSENLGIVPQTTIFNKKIAIDDRSKYKCVEYGDIVFNPYLLWNRAVGVCFLREGGCTSPAYIVLRPYKRETERFLHYFFRSFQVTNAVDAIASGSVTRRRTAPLSDILSLEFRLPYYEDQKRISRFLTNIDDMILFNHRINNILEEIACVLFRYMFIDNPEVNRWKNGHLSDLLIFQRGFDLPSPQRIQGQFPVITASGPAGTHNEYKAKGPGVTTGRSGIIGKVFFVHENFWPLNTSLWVKEFRLAKPAFAFFLLKTLNFALFNAGSVVPTLNRNHVHNLSLSIPPEELIESFEKLAIPILNGIYCNEKESQKLTSIRDLLLPNMLNGEIDTANF
jgi:type I restriction enzyme, S subunit